ncbi:MAG: DNA primase [Lachnospiraceae bacterium]|nr:DNA primase [Lachnospiraceae bacterium]
MYFSEEIIAEVQQKNDIVDVISQYVHLQKKGSNYTCCCPFHNEKTPSFSVNQARQIYKCFGCGEGGSVITFLQKYENMTFPEAIKFLAERAGVALPEETNSKANRARENRRARLLEVNKEAAKYYYYILRSSRGDVGMDYLERRGLTEETRNQFGLGYATVSGNDILAYLKSKGFKDEEIRDSGLASFSEQKGLSSKFWNRVMFPIQDSNHRVIGFGGRVMGEGEPKYLNSPETEIFDKSRNLYGLNFARTSRKKNFILCEGYMDVIALHQAGFNQAVASLGTAFTSGQANLLRRYTTDVLLAYDSDGAGTKAAIRAIQILRETGLYSKVINMKPYKDPDEFIKNLGAEEFQKRIDEAENSFLFRVRIAEQNYDMQDADGRTRFYKEVAGMLSEFADEIERENYLTAVANQYGVSRDGLREQVVKSAMRGEVKALQRPQSAMGADKARADDSKRKPQQLLLTWLAEEPELYSRIKPYITAEDFTDELYKPVAKRFLADLEVGNANPALLISLIEDPEEQSKISALFTTRLDGIETKEERQKALHDILMKVKTNSYEYYKAQSGTDIDAMKKMIEDKKALQELAKTHIFLE